MPRSPTPQPPVYVLPEPQPKVDPMTEPTIGHANVDDNIREWVLLSLWNAIGEARHGLDVAVQRGKVTLRGQLATGAQRDAAIRSVRRTQGVRGLVDCIELVHPATGREAPSGRAAGRPRRLACVSRYCGTDNASIAAAIEDAIGVLDRRRQAHRLRPSRRLFLLFRNPIAGALSIDVGLPAGSGSAAASPGEIGIKNLPPADGSATPDRPGFQATLALARRLWGANDTIPGVFWQCAAVDRVQELIAQTLILPVYWSPAPLGEEAAARNPMPRGGEF